MSAAHLLQAIAGAVVAVAIGWIVGNRCLALVVRGSRGTGDPGADDAWAPGVPERGLVALSGFCLFSAALMVLHMLTRGAVFGPWWPVPAAAVAVGVVAVATRARVTGRARVRSGRTWMKVAAAGAILFLVFVLPVIQTGSGVRTGDPPWHLGWTEQILGGEPRPTGPAAIARNAYPWGWHAVLATIVRLVPGADPLVAHESLHLLLVAGIPLGAACLARIVDRTAGWAAAGAVSLVGGWGWIEARGPSFITSPREARYGADLVVASPNSMYELFPPALPRELGLVLLAAAGVLMMVAIRSRDRTALVIAGVVTGLVGLVSVPMFVAGLVWMVAAVIFSPRPRARTAGLLLGPALATFLVWAAPVAIDYARFGGFVNITPELGKEWGLPTALASWGLLLPMAVAGVILLVTRRERLLVALVGGTSLLLVAAMIRGRLDWDLAGNATLLHQGRVWPPLHLLGAAVAGVALVEAYRRIGNRRRVVVVAVAATFAAAAVASPFLASIRLTEILDSGGGGFVYGSPDFADDSFVRAGAARLDPDDLIYGGDASDEVEFALWQFSGARIASYDDPRLEGNDLRIRFADLARRWDAVAGSSAGRGWIVEPAAGRLPAAPSVEGSFAGRRWMLFPGD